MKMDWFRERLTVRVALTVCAVGAAGATAVLALEPPDSAPPKKEPAIATGIRADVVALRRRPAGAARKAAFQFQPGTNALILADRRTIQRLSLAKKLLAQKNYTQAVGLLQKVIERDKDAFYNPDIDKRGSIQSVRIAAQRMIGALPKAGKDVYRLKFGGTAKVLLADATKTGDEQQVAEIARRYFHTDAGYSAMYRLGVLHLDQGRPMAAAMCFERLRQFPEAARKREPILSLRAAVCWNRIGMPKKAQQALQSVQRTAAGKPLVIGGHPVRLFANLEDGADWLAKHFGKPARVAGFAEADWTVFRGNPRRNAAGTFPEKPQNVAWKKTLVPDPTSDPYRDRSDQADTAIRTQLSDALTSMKNQYRQQRRNVFPSTHPIAVGGVLVTRTMSSLRAIDVRTGRLLWESFPDELIERLLTDDGKGPVPSSSVHIRTIAAQRVWGDMTWGTPSTNGEHVYSIEEVGLQYPVRLPTRNPRIFKTLTHDRRVNRLVARKVRNGRIAWIIGGSAADFERIQTGVAPDPYSGTFFLGSPLPLAGRLYCLAETEGEIRLLEFQLNSSAEPNRPRLVWAQPLVGTNLRIDNDRRRRVAGTTPSYADGILVCPTDAGYVIAVDATTRSLLWGYRYQQKTRPPRPFPRPGPQPAPTSRWLDSSCTIDNGMVLLSPRGTDDLVCLNLLDGSVFWKKKRGDGLYVAGVRDGKAIVVGSGSIRALKMSDGTSAWKRNVAISTPSGRGIATEDRLLVPLSTGEIVTVELKTGRVTEKTKTPGGRVPGNLILANGVLISQGIDTIESIPVPGWRAAAPPR